MESFVGSAVFILPGFLMYFWIQSFGVNPVLKHSTIEMGAMAALLWIPVSVATLSLYNCIGLLYHAVPVWSLDGLKNRSSNILFITIFLLLSGIVSYILSFVYVKYIYPFQSKKINEIRESRGIAPFSDNPSVWDEVFGGNIVQVVNVSKIDKQGEGAYIIGELEKVPRPFESEKCFLLRHVELFTRLVQEYNIPVSNVFIDTKSGTCIKIYDPEALSVAITKDSAPVVG